MKAAATTLLDDVLPEFDFGSRHSQHVGASPEEVQWVIDGLEIGPRASLLARLRGLRLPPGPIRQVLMRSGFTLLAERPGLETVLGTTGQFWRLREQAHMEAPRDVEAFRTFDRPGWAKAAVSLRFERREDGSTDVLTETRVRCVDEAARLRFAVYWAIIKPFSAWLRRDFLGRVARVAEALS